MIARRGRTLGENLYGRGDREMKDMKCANTHWHNVLLIFHHGNDDVDDSKSKNIWFFHNKFYKKKTSKIANCGNRKLAIFQVTLGAWSTVMVVDGRDFNACIYLGQQ